MWDRFVCFIFGNRYWSRVTTILINCNNPLGFAVGGLFWFLASGARSGFNHWLMDFLEARDVECITFDVTKTISREYEIIKGCTIFNRDVIVVLL